MDSSNQPQPTQPSEDSTPEQSVSKPEVSSSEPSVPEQPPVAQPNMQENMQPGEAATPVSVAGSTPASGEDPGQLLGIVGIIAAFFVGPVGIILGIVSRNRSRQAGHPTTVGTVALVLGIVVTALYAVLSVLWFIAAITIFNATPR